ncbi:hypothetical protein RhiirA5_427595 [Rhizophagus irregularis]|uniref:Uncharacterized protein n=2 Tax=Rhizophagus irregularis TaxID=588596 RepID=A0A2N0P212_9GLOM|nr:hypothetical protein RhiirA5_427595 [Rhizophagus irregularis]
MDNEESDLASYAHLQKLLNEGVQLPASYKQKNEVRENASTCKKTKKRVKITMKTNYSGEKFSSKFPFSSNEEDEEITNFIVNDGIPLALIVAYSFNDLYNCIPDIAPQKMTENEHCYKFLHPISRPIFSNSKKEYELTLNHANKNLTKRPVFSCVIEDIPILNSEFKPLGSIPLQCNKDELRSKGDPGEVGIFLNIVSSDNQVHDLMKTYFMNLRYDGLYSSWAFQTTMIDKASIPLADFSISHLIALKACIFFVNNNESCLLLSFVLYNRRNIVKES